MTQEEKELFLKDILPRQLYGVKVHYRYLDFVGGSERLIHEGDGVIKGINLTLGNPILIDGFHIEAENVKPYLRPFSSMTEEEEREYNEALKPLGDFMFEQEEEFRPIQLYKNIPFELYEFFNSHHFDYRGLIEKGLALEAPEGMYKTE